MGSGSRRPWHALRMSLRGALLAGLLLLSSTATLSTEDGAVFASEDAMGRRGSIRSHHPLLEEEEEAADEEMGSVGGSSLDPVEGYDEEDAEEEDEERLQSEEANRMKS